MVLNFLTFLVSVVAISLSGVIPPGPVFAITVAKGHFNENVGAYIAIGHGIVEIPLMIVIYLGFAFFFTNEIVRTFIGFVGGLMLLYMGYSTLKSPYQTEVKESTIMGGSILAGIIASGANPYFLLWWATIGVALLATATNYGLFGFIIFVVAHWSCDLIWNLIISKTVYKTKRIWKPITYKIINSICALILLSFGTWFIYSSLAN